MHTEIESFHLPRWNELPNLDLNLDQLVTILEKYLKDCMNKVIFIKAHMKDYIVSHVNPFGQKLKPWTENVQIVGEKLKQ